MKHVFLFKAHLDNVSVINHSPNITDITPTEFLFDRNQVNITNNAHLIEFTSRGGKILAGLNICSHRLPHR